MCVEFFTSHQLKRARGHLYRAYTNIEFRDAASRDMINMAATRLERARTKWPRRVICCRTTAVAFMYTRYALAVFTLSPCYMYTIYTFARRYIKQCGLNVYTRRSAFATHIKFFYTYPYILYCSIRFVCNQHCSHHLATRRNDIAMNTSPQFPIIAYIEPSDANI